MKAFVGILGKVQKLAGMEQQCGRRREPGNYENASTSKEADHTDLVHSPLLSDL